MKISYNWLKEFIAIEQYAPEQIAEILLSIGLEVEEIVRPYNIPDTVITAEIKNIAKHPNADKLTVCIVTDGSTEHQIVCGAKNINNGDKIPLALPGSKLPNGLEIKPTAIRGIESFGMLCSSKELGLNDDHSGILILPANTVLGKTLNETLGLNDIIFDVAVYPNRPDCLSILGVARELSAKLGLNLKLPDLYNPRKSENEHFPVEIVENNLCSRYIASYLNDIKVTDSSLKIQLRLLNHGLRPINNVVDITNYVLLETGHPLHSFDMDKLSGKKIIVRKAVQDENLLALNKLEYKLSSDMLVIADENSPQAIAGVIGGEISGVTKHTNNVILESALFKPQSVRSTRNKLNVSTDASYRFERGCSWEGCELAAKRALFLLLQNTDGKFVSINDTFKEELRPKKLTLRTSRLNKVLGMNPALDKKEIGDILLKLNLRVEPQDDNLNVEIPTYRLDLNEEIDLIEEVARIKGYDSIPSDLITAKIPEYIIEEPLLDLQDKTRDFLTGQGFHEVLNYSFYKNNLPDLKSDASALIEIANPLSQDTKFLRPSLLPGMFQNVLHNLNNRIEDIKLFELGKIFLQQASNKKEMNHLGIIAVGNTFPVSWKTKALKTDYYVISGLVQKLLTSTFQFSGWELSEITEEAGIFAQGQSAVVCHNKEIIAKFGLINPAYHPDINEDVFFAEVYMDNLIDKVSSDRKYSHYSNLPLSKRDLSVLVPAEITYSCLADEIHGCKTKDINIEIELFDLYKGEKIQSDKKSLSFTLYFSHKSRTLIDEEINAVIKQILEKLGKIGIMLRS
ncbi:MAG: phenylalanine--tRNA ligase subunit beta [Elusimicrobia bacterium]|nr:phenylalanine--tRNA ligase subunit beta [Elusimicrobiota bacterium]